MKTKTFVNSIAGELEDRVVIALFAMIAISVSLALPISAVAGDQMVTLMARGIAGMISVSLSAPIYFMFNGLVTR